MREFNAKLALIVLVSVGALAVAIYLLHGFQVRRQANTLKTAAEHAREEHKDADAIQFYGSYLSLRPADIDTLEEFGLYMAETAKDLRGRTHALNALEELVRKDGTRRAARRKLIDVALSLGRLSDAQTHIQYLLEKSGNAENAEPPADEAELFDLLGRCQLTMGQDQEAAASFAKAVRGAPTTIEPYGRLAYVLRQRLNRGKEADRIMAQLIKMNPKSAEACLVYGRYLIDMGSIDEAVKQATRALELAPNDREAISFAAVCAVQKRNFDQAAKYLEHGIQLAKHQSRMYRALADVQLQAGHPDEAAAVLERGLAATKDTVESLPILWSIATMRLQHGKVKEAKEIVEQLRTAADFSQAHVRFLDGQIEFSLGHWANARKLLEEVRSDLSDQPELQKRADLFIGHCYGQAGNTDQQLIAYRRALAIDPNFAPARMALANQYRATGQMGAAMEEYRQVLKSGVRGNAEALLPMIETLILRNLRLPPAERKWDEVEQLLDKASELLPDTVQIPLYRVEILLGQNRYDEAERLLKKLRDKDPKRIEFWRGLILVAQRQEKWDQVEKLLDDAEKQLGDQPAMRIVRAQYLVRRYKSQAAGDMRKLAEKTEKFSPQEQFQLWAGLLSYAQQAGDSEQARLMCEKMVAKEPNNLRLRFQLFELTKLAHAEQPRAQLLKELDPIVDQLKKIGGRTPEWLYAKAVCLAIEESDSHEAQLDEALKLLAEARGIRPEWVPVLIVGGNICFDKSRFDEALEYYLQAIKLEHYEPEVVRRSIQLLSQRQRFEEAKQILARLAERDSPLMENLERAYSELEARSGQIDRALELARKQVVANPESYQDRLWLARMLATASRTAKGEQRVAEATKLQDEAEKSYRRALELNPRAPDCWVSLVQFLAATDQMPKASEAIDQAKAAIPAPRADLTLAQCYEAVKDTENAQKRYEAARAAAPNNVMVDRVVADFYTRVGKSAEAEPLLKEMIDGKKKGGEADVVWARRAMARLLRARGDFPSMKEARTLVEQNLKSPFASVDDLRLKAQLQLADPRRSGAAEAAKTLAALGDKASVEDRFLLAQLYLLQGDFPKYRTEMRAVLGTAKPDPQHVAAYVQALLLRNETTEADLWVSKLEQAFPNQFAVLNLRADLLVRRGQANEAIELLTSFVDQKDAQPKDPVDRSRLVSEALERLAGRLATAKQKAAAAQCIQKADALLRTYAQQRHDGPMLLAAFLARQEHFAEALDILEKFAKAAPPEALSDMSYPARLFFHDCTAREQIQRGEKIMLDALKKSNRAVPLLIAMAESYTYQQRYQEAETLYQEIITRDPRNAIALNNLAVLLTFRNDRLDESLKLIDRAIEIAGPVGAMLDSRASVRIARGEAAEALADLQQALVEEESPVRLFHQARAYLLAGKKAEAAAALESAQSKGLKPSMLDAPERPQLDKLRNELQ